MCGSAGSGGKDKAMITLYGGPTPNARKIAIALLEMGLEWRLDPVDILAGDQLTPEFLALNPNNKTPVIVDDAGPHGPGFVLGEDRKGGGEGQRVGVGVDRGGRR